MMLVTKRKVLTLWKKSLEKKLRGRKENSIALQMFKIFPDLSIALDLQLSFFKP